MSQDTGKVDDKLIREIQEKLSSIQQKLDENILTAENNRNAAIEMIRFITDTVNNVAPGKIYAQWYGSYTNSGVGDYPNLSIHAMHGPTHRLLAKWRINAGGDYPPPMYTQQEILEIINSALESIRV